MNREEDSPLQDPRITGALSLLRSFVEEKQQALKKPKPPDPSLSTSFQELLTRAERARGAPLWHPYISSGMGRGSLVQLLDGSVKIDFISGIGTHPGHLLPELLEAQLEGILQDQIMQGNLQQSYLPLQLMEELLAASQLDHAFLTTSGAMACENGLKIALQHNYPRHRILAFSRCFMGRSCTLSRITDKASYREGLPESLPVDYLPYYQPDQGKESSAASLARMRELINRYPREYALFTLELIQGEGGGFVAPPRDFFLPLLEEARQAGMLILFDEVQTFGRTEKLFAYQALQLEEFADIVTIGKLLQSCATLFRHSVAPRPGLLSQTFTASTSAIATGRLILHKLLTEGYFGEEGQNMRRHRHFLHHLEQLASRYPGKISGPYGRGMMVAFTPGRGTIEEATKWVRTLFAKGVVAFISGHGPIRVRFLPPVLSATEEEIDQVAEICEEICKEGGISCPP